MAFLDLFLGATIVMLATSIGAIGSLVFRGIDENTRSILLSFCAGVMIFSAIEMVTESHALSGDLIAFLGFILGLLVFFIFEKILPHIHGTIGKKEFDKQNNTATLLGVTISLHNIPEGFAVASAFAASTPLGWLVTTSIACQDIPEGLIVSAPLMCQGVSAKRSVLWGLFSGAVEFLAAIVGYLFLSAISIIIPFVLAFSAGAMGYIAFVELFLESLNSKSKTYSKKKNSIILSFIFGMIFASVIAAFLNIT